MSDEIIRVLKMVEEGKISSEKAAELINALKNQEERPKIENKNLKVLKIKIVSEDGDNVNVTLPVNFVKTLIKSTGKLPVNIEGVNSNDIDINAIIGAIDSGIEGKFVDIKSEDGDIIEISIE